MFGRKRRRRAEAHALELDRAARTVAGLERRVNELEASLRFYYCDGCGKTHPYHATAGWPDRDRLRFTPEAIGAGMNVPTSE